MLTLRFLCLCCLPAALAMRKNIKEVSTVSAMQKDPNLHVHRVDTSNSAGVRTSCWTAAALFSRGNSKEISLDPHSTKISKCEAMCEGAEMASCAKLRPSAELMTGEISVVDRANKVAAEGENGISVTGLMESTAAVFYLYPSTEAWRINASSHNPYPFRYIVAYHAPANPPRDQSSGALTWGSPMWAKSWQPLGSPDQVARRYADQMEHADVAHARVIVAMQDSDTFPKAWPPHDLTTFQENELVVLKKSGIASGDVALYLEKDLENFHVMWGDGSSLYFGSYDQE